jgi:superfamily II DNA helicase RecQ
VQKEIFNSADDNLIHVLLRRGEEFRKDFQRIGQELLPQIPETPVLCFTATAPPAAQTRLQSCLLMQSPVIITKNPDRPNIMYEVIQRPPSTKTEDHLDEIITALAQSLKDERMDFPQTIVYTDTATIAYSYWLTEQVLGQDQYEGESIPENRIFAQYHKGATSKIKDLIVSEICKTDSKLRLVFATVALGMGLDAPHIRRIIHYKPPTSIEQYFQETGRAGRDGKPATGTLYFNNTDIRQNRRGMTSTMIDFCRTKTCYRGVLLQYMGHALDNGRDMTKCCSNCSGN